MAGKAGNPRANCAEPSRPSEETPEGRGLTPRFGRTGAEIHGDS